ncbi:hypothetical protein CANARDRAFT_24667 [[Candida] arabinofermentans NRRL YB-2248]|uniref:Uncharacterized protein n=1 Tax=[Candida] arabinofermentans NRRL YB-2248 TaxID=983967 RepID=A0A1E4SW04_9ASCO|nr:hypothetical protein CANARDRAFT_24667 [[Candida] arabinofermentans NRRL YB-2248]
MTQSIDNSNQMSKSVSEKPYFQIYVSENIDLIITNKGNKFYNFKKLNKSNWQITNDELYKGEIEYIHDNKSNILLLISIVRGFDLKGIPNHELLLKKLNHFVHGDGDLELIPTPINDSTIVADDISPDVNQDIIRHDLGVVKDDDTEDQTYNQGSQDGVLGNVNEPDITNKNGLNLGYDSSSDSDSDEDSDSELVLESTDVEKKLGSDGDDVQLQADDDDDEHKPLDVKPSDDESDEQEMDGQLQLSDLSDDEQTGQLQSSDLSDDEQTGQLQLSDLSDNEQQQQIDTNDIQQYQPYFNLLSSLNMDPYSTYDLESSNFITHPAHISIDQSAKIPDVVKNYTNEQDARIALFEYWCHTQRSEHEHEHEHASQIQSQSQSESESQSDSNYDEPLAEHSEYITYLQDLNSTKKIREKYYTDFKRRNRTTDQFKSITINDKLKESIFKKFITFKKLKSTEKVQFVLNLVLKKNGKFEKFININDIKEPVQNHDFKFTVSKFESLGFNIVEEIVEWGFLTPSEKQQVCDLLLK